MRPSSTERSTQYGGLRRKIYFLPSRTKQHGSICVYYITLQSRGTRLVYNGREGHPEERTVKKTRHIPREMPGFQETVTQKPKEICGCCLQNSIHQLKQFFIHISGNVAVALRTSHLQADFTKCAVTCAFVIISCILYAYKQ